MNYEEKYKEALEKLRAFHRDYKNISHLVDVKEELEFIFPELKESEDERIRKALIEVLHRLSDSTFEYGAEGGYVGATKEKMLAWLEKQAEQKVSCNEEDEENFGKLHRLIVICQGKKKFIPSDEYDKLDNWLKSLKERVQPQSMQEWDEEDEKMLDNCIGLIQEIDSTQEEQNWLNSLKDRVQPQPKQEWSEKDNERIERIYHFIWKNRKGDTSEIYQQEQDAEWLKSLKPNHWKPSEQNIKDLEWCADLVQDKLGVGFHRLQVFIDEIKNL